MQQYSYDTSVMKLFRRSGGLLLSLAATAPVLFGCSKADSSPAVATVSLTLSRTAVPVGSPVDLTYRFEVAPDAKIAEDYRVFVHLNRDDGTTIWTDDHDLPQELATSRWTPGKVIQYTRTRFIPVLSYLGGATVEMGLYRQDDRLPLSGPDPADRDSPARGYKVATLDLLPQSESILLIRKSGWHQGEYDSADPAVEWQWTQKVATLGVRNPRRDVMFYLEFNSRPDVFPDGPQQVSVYVGPTVVATFRVDAPEPSLQRIPISAAQLGDGEMVELRLEVDRTFVPAKLAGGGRDSRELGIRVFHAYVEPK